MIFPQDTLGFYFLQWQILFARMTGTLILSGIYQFWAKVDEAPFGSREVRGLLIARGVGGFFGGKWR